MDHRKGDKWIIEKEIKLMLIARRDQEAKSIPKMRDVKEISESHKFEHGLASPFVLSVHIINELPNMGTSR